jgi:plastocyanin
VMKVFLVVIALLALADADCDTKDEVKPKTAAPSVVVGKGVIRGKVTFTGRAPEMKTIDNVPCHDGAAKQLTDETVVVNENGTLRNVLVYLKGAPAVDVSNASPVVLDQKDCRYVPHVIGVLVGQKLVFLSSDPTLHNVHYNPDRNAAANFGFTSAGSERTVTFDVTGDFIRVKCDVHPWMTGYVGVFENSWFATTGDSGAFELKAIPDGSYKLVAWHELYGSKEQDVTISDEKPMDVEMSYASPDAKNK